jgi:hypothetical protein
MGLLSATTVTQQYSNDFSAISDTCALGFIENEKGLRPRASYERGDSCLANLPSAWLPGHSFLVVGSTNRVSVTSPYPKAAPVGLGMRERCVQR